MSSKQKLIILITAVNLIQLDILRRRSSEGSTVIYSPQKRIAHSIGVAKVESVLSLISQKQPAQREAKLA